MNILYTCNEFPPAPHGGLGTFVKEISHELKQKGHTVVVYGIYPDVKERTIEEKEGVVLVRDPKYKQKGRLARIKEIYNYGKAVNELVKKYKINIVEAHDTGGYFLFIKHKPLFVRLHNGERYFKKRDIVTVVIEKLSFVVKKLHIIGVSDFILGMFEKAFKIHATSTKSVIYNGIKITSPYTLQSDSKNIVYAGTIKPIKGIDILLEAFALSGLYNEGYQLKLYGNDTLYNGISYFDYVLNQNNKAKELYANGKIVFHGPLKKEELMQKFSTSAMCVFPSLMESFGLVVIEAMSQGACIIYSDQGAAKEIVSDNVDGFLFANGDAKDLAQKMIELSKASKDKLESIKANATKKANKYSLDRCVSDSIALYKKYLK